MNEQVLEKQKTEPRLEPIENPDSLRMKLAYWMTGMQMGKVITPLKVIYSRFPESFGFLKGLKGVENKFTIDPELKNLIKIYIASLNGCTFCVDIAKAELQKEGNFSNKLNDLMRFRESEHFSNDEKAALAYVEEASENKHVQDETFDRLNRYFSEEEIVQITMINAIENFYNLMNAPLNIGSDEFCKLWNEE